MAIRDAVGKEGIFQKGSLLKFTIITTKVNKTAIAPT